MHLDEACTCSFSFFCHKCLSPDFFWTPIFLVELSGASQSTRSSILQRRIFVIFLILSVKINENTDSLLLSNEGCTWSFSICVPSVLVWVYFCTRTKSRHRIEQTEEAARFNQFRHLSAHECSKFLYPALSHVFRCAWRPRTLVVFLWFSSSRDHLYRSSMHVWMLHIGPCRSSEHNLTRVFFFARRAMSAVLFPLSFFYFAVFYTDPACTFLIRELSFFDLGCTLLLRVLSFLIRRTIFWSMSRLCQT